jgi:hypothetical protein
LLDQKEASIRISGRIDLGCLGCCRDSKAHNSRTSSSKGRSRQPSSKHGLACVGGRMYAGKVEQCNPAEIESTGLTANQSLIQHPTREL